MEHCQDKDNLDRKKNLYIYEYTELRACHPERSKGSQVNCCKNPEMLRGVYPEQREGLSMALWDLLTINSTKKHLTKTPY
jgi:hypothetical protein